MSRGGSRIFSGRPGRPKGAKDRMPRKRKKLPDELKLAPVRNALRQLYETQGLERLLEFLDSPSERVRFEAYKLLAVYNLGQPSDGVLKPEIETIESVIREIAAKRRAALPAAPDEAIDTPVVSASAGPSDRGEAPNAEADADADMTQGEGHFEPAKTQGR